MPERVYLYRCSLKLHCFSSWQQMADFDLPASVDFILNETKQSKLYLTGDSMGGTIVLAFLSEHHSYDSKVSLIEQLFSRSSS